MGQVDSWWLLPRLVSWWPALQLVSDDPSAFVQLTTQRNWYIRNVLTEIVERGAGGGGNCWWTVTNWWKVSIVAKGYCAKSTDWPIGSSSSSRTICKSKDCTTFTTPDNFQTTWKMATFVAAFERKDIRHTTPCASKVFEVRYWWNVSSSRSASLSDCSHLVPALGVKQFEDIVLLV